MEIQDAAKISGPPLLSTLLNCGLLGVLSVQVLLYYLAFPHDWVYMKCLVYGIYVLEVMQSILFIENGFRIFVTSFGDVEAVDRVGTAWLSVPILTAIETTIVQGFYMHRISVLSRSKKVLGVLVVLSFVQLGGGIAVGVQAHQTEYYSLLRTPGLVIPAYTSIGIWNVGGVLCDVIIAICMTYYLSQLEGDTTIKVTKTIIKKFIRLSIETGSLTAVIAIVSFGLAMLPNNYYQAPMGIIGKVYANSMLVLMNSRMLLGSEEDPALTIIMSAMRFDAAPANDSAHKTEV